MTELLSLRLSNSESLTRFLVPMLLNPLDESNSPVDLNLGHWEVKAFGVRKTSVPKTPSIRKAPNRAKPSNTGF